MDLIRCGKLLSNLRKAKGMTQKQVADRLGVLPKTVSKWETGKGFPDISVISALSDVLGVSEKILLSGNLTKNITDTGNIGRTRFYVCPECMSVMQGTGKCEIICCGKPVKASESKEADGNHIIKISEIENDFCIEFNHEMTKDHYINFVSYTGSDRILTIRLHPEQNPLVRFPKMYRGKLYFYCNKHGLFEYKIK